MSYTHHTHRTPRPLCRAAGFTLIETLVAMSIAGVLSSIAYPSFEGVLQRARRSDALVSMMNLQLVQERWRSNSMSYGSLEQIGMPALTPSGHYRLQASASGATGYEVTATALGAQARDAACRVLRLSVSGGDALHASGPDDATSNPASVNQRCWSL